MSGSLYGSMSSCSECYYVEGGCGEVPPETKLYLRTPSIHRFGKNQSIHLFQVKKVCFRSMMCLWEVYILDLTPKIPVANQGLDWDSLLKMSKHAMILVMTQFIYRILQHHGFQKTFSHRGIAFFFAKRSHITSTISVKSQAWMGQSMKL